jgi:hypothetical protein
VLDPGIADSTGSALEEESCHLRQSLWNRRLNTAGEYSKAYIRFVYLHSCSYFMLVVYHLSYFLLPIFSESTVPRPVTASQTDVAMSQIFLYIINIESSCTYKQNVYLCIWLAGW